jgi:hypothetical protein
MTELCVLEWSFKRITDLHALGVKEITLTKEAAKVLTGNLKGLHTDAPVPADWRPRQIGQLCGISFFVTE